VRAELTVLAPATFVAVTATRIRVPTSVEVSVYAAPVAPAIAAQVVPARSQRRHWWVYIIGDVPDHVPVSAVSVEPAVVPPTTIGDVVFVGGVATGGGAEHALVAELSVTTADRFPAASKLSTPST
jgi:hypothetical protein